MEVQMRKEYIFLCDSNRPLQMSVNISLVMLSMIKSILSSRSLDGMLFYIAPPNSFLKYFNENWYIGSIKAKSVITK